MSRVPHIFAKGDLSSVLESLVRTVGEKVAQLPLEQVEGEAVLRTRDKLWANYHVEPLTLNWDARTDHKEEVRVERPSDFGGTVKRQDILLRLHVPFLGDKDLFTYSPTGIPINAPRAEVYTGYIEFRYQAPSHDLSSMVSDFQWDERLTKQMVVQVNERVEGHNRRLGEHIDHVIEARREKLRADDEALGALGFNIRRHDHVPATYDLPIIQKTIQLPPPPLKPVAVPAPDPAISARIYDEILKVLASMSLAVERSPTAFARIQEEHLRDWFLVALNGHFHGDATGETFNNEGKTDIMIRVGGAPIFIAECKFWGGEKILLETIDQLLGYLTWRDSKAAILVFSRNADFTAVLRQIPEVVKKHTHFVREVSRAETSFRFHLRNKTDPAREHLVTLLAFNIPRATP